MEHKADPWRCRHCMRMVKGVVSQCGGCHQHWTHCMDTTYVHQPRRRVQQAEYAGGWEETPWRSQDYGWVAERPKSPRQRTQSPRQRQTRSKSQKKHLNYMEEEDHYKGKGKVGKTKGKESFAPMPPSTQWLSPPSMPSSVAPEAASATHAESLMPSLSSLPAMQPFPKPKGPKEDTELASLRLMYKELKDKPNLPDDIQQVVKNAEATLRRADAKSHKQLIDQLKVARKKLADLDEQWEAYRVQWASYIEKASQLWLSHVEDFESGEAKFVEKRKETMQHLQETRQRLHEVHLRTMEQGTEDAGADMEVAQEALDATKQLEEQETLVLDSDFSQIKKELTGVVKQVKDTIEDRLRGRDRSRSRSKKDLDDVEILEPTPKRCRDSD